MLTAQDRHYSAISAQGGNMSVRFYFAFVLGFVMPSMLYAAGQVSQFGITWTFDRDYTVGQFANGDYYVVGPVTITSISPASTDVSGRVKNGTMINPAPLSSSSRQGYDNSMAGNTYDDSANKAFNVSSSNPLIVQPGSSLVSTISIDNPGNTPQLKTAAILTVLAAVPPAGSFRPAYAGTDKTIRYNKNQLKYTLLKKLTPVGSTPTLATVEQQFEKPWIDHRGTAGGRYYHPSDNMPDYGREIAAAVGEGALMLHLNFTDQQKEKLLVRYVQLGIDLYGIVAAGGTKNWEPDGGHASGRKWPIMFAGLMLDDTKMASIGSIAFSQLYFGEDGQTFYVSPADVDIANTVTEFEGTSFNGHFYGPGPKEYQEYTAADIGLPEWGIRHATYPLYDGKDWDNAAYRRCCTANVWAGFVLAARIMNQKAAWNHDALFDYMDRYMALEVGTGNRQQSQFTENMWDIYRANYGSAETPNNPATAAPSETATAADDVATSDTSVDGTTTSGTTTNGSSNYELNGDEDAGGYNGRIKILPPTP
jgi:hypothetical protein